MKELLDNMKKKKTTIVNELSKNVPHEKDMFSNNAMATFRECSRRKGRNSKMTMPLKKQPPSSTRTRMIGSWQRGLGQTPLPCSLCEYDEGQAKGVD